MIGLPYTQKKPENVLGIGDTIADAGSLNYASIPAAPANATDELRRNVRRLHVVKEDSQAVAQIVRHFVIAPSSRY